MRMLLAAVVGFVCCAQAGVAQEPEHKATDKVVVRAWLIEVPQSALKEMGLEDPAGRKPEEIPRLLKEMTQPFLFRWRRIDGQRFASNGNLLPGPPVPLGQIVTLQEKPVVLSEPRVETTAGKWGTFDNTTAIQYLEKQKATHPPLAEKAAAPEEQTYVVRTLTERAGTVFKAKPETGPDGQVAFEFEFSWTRVDSRSPVEGAESLPVGLPALRILAVKSKLAARPGVPVLAGERSRVTTHTDDKGNKTEFKERVYLLLEVEIPKADE